MQTFLHRHAHAQGTAAPGRILAGPGLRRATAQRPEIRHILGRAAVQPKLKVGAPDDAYEREADRVADQVMRMADPAYDGSPLVPPAHSRRTVQRMCAECEEEQALRRQPNEEEEEPEIKRQADGRAPEVSPTMARQVGALQRGGRPLPESARAFFEPRMGRDLGEVRVHTDEQAAVSAQALRARAYTIGRHIVFGRNEYAPATSGGRHLIAHELAHVAQQADGSGAPVVRRAASDFKITEIAPEDAANPDMIFFEAGATSIPASERHKIAGLATPPARDLTLNGFSSEEGTDAANDAVINARLRAVDAALAAAGHTGARVRVNLRASGEGQIDYRHMRSVEVIPTPVGLPAAPSGQPPCAAPGSEVEPCGTAFTGSWPDAVSATQGAVTALTPPTSAAATSLLSTLFSAIPLPTVLGHVTNIARQVVVLPAQHRCHNSCDSGCGRPAYNTGTGVGPSGNIVTLCPDFLNSTVTAWQSQILIHESAHGTPGLSAKDIAYGSSRQISFLTPADQVRNTDSYLLLIWLLFRPGSLTIGPGTPDTLTAMTGAETTAANGAVAWLESWLNYGDFDTEILYDTVNRSVAPAPAWDTSQQGDAFSRETMQQIAPIFGLTDPGPAAPFVQPVDADRMRIAAIHDRYDQMYSAVNFQVLTVTKGAPGSDAWGSHGASLPRLGQNVTVGAAFFGMSPADRVKHLVLLMATAMHGISSGFRTKYVDALDAIRTHRSLGP